MKKAGSLNPTAFATNWNALVFSFAVPLCAIVAALAFVPLYRNLHSVSAYAFLEERFGAWARMYGSVCFLVMQTARSGVILYLLALLLKTLFGWSVPMIILVVGLTTCVYSMLGGMLVAAIVAAAMSTVSATLNSGATVIMEDWFKRYFKRDASERACVLMLRTVTVFLGFASIAIAFAVIGVESALSTWWMLQSVLSGGMLGLFLLGCVSKRVSKGQAAVATVLGVITVAWIIFGQKALHPNLAIVFGTIVLFASGLGLAAISSGKCR